MTKVFWNKFESLNPASEVGPNLTNYGTQNQVVAGKFGNAVYQPLMANPNSDLDRLYSSAFVSTLVNDWTQFSVGMWVKLDYNVVAGIPSSAPPGYNNFMSCNFQPHPPGQTPEIMFFAYSEGFGIYLNSALWSNTDVNCNITAGVWTYLRFVIKKSRIGISSDTIRMYVGDTLAGSTNMVLPVISFTGFLIFLNNATAIYGMQGAIDNVTIWDDVNEDCSTRFWEDEEGIPTGLTASQNLPVQVNLAWSPVVGDVSTYNVYRATNSGGPYNLVQTTAGLSWADTTGIPGQHYFYRVTSVTPGAESVKSAYAEGWTFATSTPIRQNTKTILPIPVLSKIPNIFNKDAKAIHLASEIDTDLLLWSKDVNDFRRIPRPDECPSYFLDDLGNLVHAGIYPKDSDATKREKIANAVNYQKSRSLWIPTQSIIEGITGYFPDLYPYSLDSSDWILMGGVEESPFDSFYWATLGTDGADLSLGLDLIGSGREFEVYGNVRIDLHPGINTPVLTADIIADVVLALSDIVPAYFRVYLGYFDVSGDFQIYDTIE